MFKLSTIMAAVSLHLAVALMMTFQQFTMSSLICLLLNVIVLSEVNMANQPSDFWAEWFLDFTALFFVFETLITISWGLTETVIRLGLSTIITEDNCYACNFFKQLIPTIVVLSFYYWPSPRIHNCCTIIVETFATPKVQVTEVQPLVPGIQPLVPGMQSQLEAPLPESKPVVQSK